MSFIGLNLPNNIKSSLSKIKVPGKRCPVDEYHITLIYIGSNVSDEENMKYAEVCVEMFSEINVIPITLTKFSCFPKGNDGVPIIVKVESEELVDLHYKMRKKFEKMGVKFTYPEYKPHVTLSYADESVEEVDLPAKLTFTCDAIEFWPGDSENNNMFIHYPLNDGIKDFEINKLAMQSNVFKYYSKLIK